VEKLTMAASLFLQLFFFLKKKKPSHGVKTSEAFTNPTCSAEEFN
jgi:hypothetical protein